MFSLQGRFKDNKIELNEPLYFDKEADIIVTFLEKSPAKSAEGSEELFSEPLDGLDLDEADDEPLFLEETEDGESEDLKLEPEMVIESEFSEDQYATIRKFKRFKAKGFLNLIINDEEKTFELNDYSSGGLSFLSNEPFEAGKSLTAFIKDPVEQGMSVLDFEIEVVRVIENQGNYKIGCRFFDEVDEDLWHSLIK